MEQVRKHALYALAYAILSEEHKITSEQARELLAYMAELEAEVTRLKGIINDKD